MCPDIRDMSATAGLPGCISFRSAFAVWASSTTCLICRPSSPPPTGPHLQRPRDRAVNFRAMASLSPSLCVSRRSQQSLPPKPHPMATAPHNYSLPVPFTSQRPIWKGVPNRDGELARRCRRGMPIVSHSTRAPQGRVPRGEKLDPHICVPLISTFIPLLFSSHPIPFLAFPYLSRFPTDPRNPCAGWRGGGRRWRPGVRGDGRREGQTRLK